MTKNPYNEREENMEPLHAMKEIQWYADICTLAIQAEYGLDYLEKERRPDLTATYLENGVKVCQLLLRGFEASRSNQFSPEQLQDLHTFSSVKADLERSGNTEENVRGVLEALQKILVSLKSGPGSQQKSSRVEELKRFFRGVAEPYLERATDELNSVNFQAP